MTIKQTLTSIATGITVPISCGLALVGASLTLSVPFYGLMAAQEGIERMCGIRATNKTAKLIEKKVALGHSGEFPYGIFEFPDGQRTEIYDSPVVTEGTFLPGNRLVNTQTGSIYEVKTFGSQKWVERLVDARKIR